MLRKIRVVARLKTSSLNTSILQFTDTISQNKRLISTRTTSSC